MIVEYIDEHKDRLGVEPICAELQIAPSTYYAAKARPPSARSVTDAATTAVIKDVHAANYGVYGVRKVHAEVNRQGHQVARCTVARLMRGAGLRGISRAKGTYLSAQFARLTSRRGHNRAAVAVAHSILVSAYWMLVRDEPYHDLGAGWLDEPRRAEAHTRRLVTQLEHLGHTVVLDPAS